MRNLLLFTVLLSVGLLSCSPNNVTKDDSLKKYFEAENLTGCFGLFDNALGEFTIYNLPRFRDSAYLPASTFKIVNSLIGVQTGKVNDENTIIPWDGITRPVAAWNRDLTMIEAFHVSAVPWYQELARRIGKDTMQHWLDTLGYAAQKGRAIIGQIDTFWLDNSMKITADEELGLVKKLYFEQLPFFAHTQQIVNKMMLQENNANYRLSYKTAWGHTENGHSLGWIVGWIEENRRPYFFVLQLESPDKDYDMSTVRLSILKEILKQYGFMEGKK